MSETTTIIQSETRARSYFVENPRFPFCKGCGHTNVLRKLDEALASLQLAPQDVVLVTDIGCIGMSDALFRDIHTVHTTHGRSTAFATGIALADSVLAKGRLKPIVLIGDGGAMIGLQHLVHAAMLNVDVTVLLCNNFVYGMTGGQGSGLTPECFVTATTPKGNIVPPVDMCEILKNSNAPFVARGIATDRGLGNLLKEAITFSGFAVVEILELCTEYAVLQNELTGKKLLEIAEKNHWKIGIIKDSSGRAIFAERLKEVENAAKDSSREQKPPTRYGRSNLKTPVSILVAGSAGEKVQSAAAGVCQAAMFSGLNVTQKNDNPVTQGSGFSMSELWISSGEIGYTGIECPKITIVISEDGLKELQSRNTLQSLRPQSCVYVDDSLPAHIGVLEGATVARLPFRKLFGAPMAAAAALAYAARIHEFIPKAALEGHFLARLGPSYDKFAANLETLLRWQK